LAPRQRARGDERPYDRAHFEQLFATKADPWDYTNEFAQTQYEQTLSLLPEGPISSALELGCAEGHFTVQLAPRVASLTAADLSEVALGRARDRCKAFTNVSFVQLDVAHDPLPGPVDLLVCSELLYYLLPEQLGSVADKLGRSLKPGGYLVSSHVNFAVDGPERPAIDWPHAFGGKRIRQTLEQAAGLRLVREIRTPLYSVQLLQRSGDQPVKSAQIEERELPPLSEQLARLVVWEGEEASSGRDQEPAAGLRLPILAYHRIAEGVGGLAGRFAVTPAAFEQQLRYLRDAGYYSVQFDDWRTAAAAWRPLEGRPVLLTFDDGYHDFLTDAWPLLERYGFTGTVFVVTGLVGKTAPWQGHEGTPLLDWADIRRLAARGITFGAHSHTHAPLTGLPPDEVVQEVARSRLTLQRELARTVTSFAYPYGDADLATAHLVGASGYTYGVTTDERRCTPTDDLLFLPRITILQSTSFERFVRSLGQDVTA
jgi:peptidoglycan/xylan/chitin deacetylase (PgdA/CDA1 family)/2-polyprenyl-3-methyl-5-hydroxy-6-metoxy-1,4-benzoquinol methylase